MQPGGVITPGSDQQVSAAPEQAAFSQEFPANPPVQANVGQDVSWTASEYVSHDKDSKWFVLLGLGLFVVIVLVFAMTRDILASVLVGVAGITFGIFAARPPRVLSYRLDERGIVIGEKYYPYNELKSFTIDDHSVLPAVLIMPMKRFLPPITIYFSPEEADKIIDTLADYLPHEDKAPDAVDRLMSRIRF